MLRAVIFSICMVLLSEAGMLRFHLKAARIALIVHIVCVAVWQSTGDTCQSIDIVLPLYSVHC